ncbi:MAG: 4'-phosphopantetheinyl transferase superfamily protein [Gammaproteobacteria bacterium]|nr:4'-phosphopantetheinyl transferase superfamily protein [Gammaproteobacteria bacterium]
MINPISLTELAGTPNPPGLREDEIHIWYAYLDEAGFDDMANCRNLLSMEESRRAARFHFPCDRRRFSLSRTLLRLLLSRYTGQSPERLQYLVGTHGKPSLPGDPLHFNVSGSRDLAAFAFSARQSLGIDVEYRRTVPDALDIAQQYFTFNEWQALNATPSPLQTQAFLQCWTRKEAFVKAVGQGLSMPLQNFEVTLMPGQPACLIHIDKNPAEASAWSLFHLEPGRDYVGALAIKGRGWQLTTRILGPYSGPADAHS